MIEVDVAVPANALLGECPIWSPEEEVLYWEDIDGRLVHRYDPATGEDLTRELPGRPGSMVLTSEPGRLLIAAETELVWFDWPTGEHHSLGDSGTLGNRKPDERRPYRSGGPLLGGFDVRVRRRRCAIPVACTAIEGDGSFTVTRGGVGVPNGLAFDTERNRMYWADSLTRTVLCYDYDLETGEARNERVFVEFGDLPGRPDGACIDVEGCYWVAAVRGAAVLRFTPDGALDRRIDLPVTKPSMTLHSADPTWEPCS